MKTPLHGYQNTYKQDWSYFDLKSTAIRKTFKGEPVSVGGSKIIGGLVWGVQKV